MKKSTNPPQVYTRSPIRHAQVDPNRRDKSVGFKSNTSRPYSPLSAFKDSMQDYPSTGDIPQSSRTSKSPLNAFKDSAADEFPSTGDISSRISKSPLSAFKDSTADEFPSTGDVSSTPPVFDSEEELEDALLIHDDRRKSYLDSTNYARGRDSQQPSKADHSSNPPDFLTLNSSVPNKSSAFLQATVPSNLLSLTSDTWYTRNNLPPPPALEQISQKYAPTSFRHSTSSYATQQDSRMDKESTLRSKSLERHAYDPASVAPPHTFLHIPQPAPKSHHEQHLKSYEQLETQAYEAEAKKIKEKYELLLASFETDKLADFMFKVETIIGAKHSKRLASLDTENQLKMDRFVEAKAVEYRSLSHDTNETWRGRLEKFEADQKREFDRSCRTMLDEYEEKLSKSLRVKKEEAKAKFERDLALVDDKYEDLAGREKKRKHLEGLKLIEDLDDGLKVDMKKMKEEYATKLTTAEGVYAGRIRELEERSTAAEKEYGKGVEERYLQIDKDKMETFKLSSQAIEEKELALKTKRERIRLEEDEVRRMELEVKGFRHNILIEKRDQIEHENRAMTERAPRSPKITMNDLSFDAEECEEGEASNVSLDIEELTSDVMRRKSVHMQKLDREFEKEESQIIAARNLLEVQGQTFSAKQKELDTMQSKWANDITDIRTLMETEVHAERRSRNPTMSPPRHREPSLFPIPNDFKPADNGSSAYHYHNKGENIYLNEELNPVNEGISKIIDMLKESKESAFAHDFRRSTYPNAEHIVGERRYNIYPLQIPRHIPESFSIRAQSKHNRFVDASANKSELLLREHQRWFRGFTARNSGFVR